MSLDIPQKITFRPMEQNNGEAIISSLPWEGVQQGQRSEKKWNRGCKPRIHLGLKGLVKKYGIRSGAYASFSSDLSKEYDLQKYIDREMKATNGKSLDFHTSNSTIKTCDETLTENSAMVEQDAAFVCQSSPSPQGVPLEISPDSFSLFEANGTRWIYSDSDNPYLQLNIFPKRDGTGSSRRRRYIRSLLPPCA